MRVALFNLKLKVRPASIPAPANLGALAHALAPVAKLCLRSGLGAGEFMIAAKLACVKVAAENARIGDRLNQLSISALTRLARKEIRALERLSRLGRPLTQRPVARQRTARVLHGWRTDPQFLDKAGHSIQLRMHGAGLTFRSLVRRYGGDVTPVAGFKEFLRAGAVSKTSPGLVRVRETSLREKGFEPEVGSEFSSRLPELGNAMVNNIENHANPLFVGFRDILNLSRDEAALFHSTFSERAATLVDGVDRWRQSQSKIRTALSQEQLANVRVGLGVFLVGHEEGAPPQVRKKRQGPAKPKSPKRRKS